MRTLIFNENGEIIAKIQGLLDAEIVDQIRIRGELMWVASRIWHLSPEDDTPVELFIFCSKELPEELQ